ncbi:uncharacterized protein BBA_09936 [Beauveria bassiana ARSEF 2860]|uniref:Uncharacterized protein n=1 Tax=Beauveria bassiana (strain ARSEF 2860) TaxID=655819 RepID=J5JAU0_BEAB2|nr:uncharacterized protein BBA_09936 [Beauveria bassiana ARSEF 2860]EJP61131.1 hypothetical protein BBA_09936 [Beauveria bassiana ARSEF 2860]
MQATPLFAMLPSIDPLEYISGFTTYAILVVYLAIRLSFKETFPLVVGLPLCIVSLLVCALVFGISRLRADTGLQFGSFNALRLANWLCISIQASQWCWVSILVMSMVPALTAYSIASAINDEDLRRDTLRKVRRTMAWLAVPVLTGLALTLPCCVLSAEQVPPLHKLQFSTHGTLGQVVLALLQRKSLLGRIGRDYDDNEHRRASPSTSRETLANHAEDPENALVDLDRDVTGAYHLQLQEIYKPRPQNT